VSQSDFVTRGQALVSSGQYQEAVKVCRLGLLGRPTTVEGRVVLGTALLALKRYDEVLAEMRVALELDHASVAAQILKGEALLKKGDGHGALEVLTKLRSQGLADTQAAALLAEAERIAGQSPTGEASAEDPDFAAEQGTKNYPARLEDSVEDTGGEYTRPTSLAAPGARKRSSDLLPGHAPGGLGSLDRTPPPAVLAVGDRSGTVEVDPELDRVDSRTGEDELGELVGPPVARAQAPEAGRAPARRSGRSPAPVPAGKQQKRRSPMFKEESSTVELGDEEIVEVEDRAESRTRAGRRPPGPGTQVRNAVKMPSGPIDLPPSAPPSRSAHQMPAQRSTQVPAQAPPHLAQLIANQPHVMNMAPPQPVPLPPQPQLSARSQIAAALPTAAALPMPEQHTARGVPPPGAIPLGGPRPMAHAPMPLGGPQQPMAHAPMSLGGPPPVGHAPMPPAPSPGQVPHHLQQTMLAIPQQPPPAPQPMAAIQLPPHLQTSAAAARPTLALNPQQQQSASAVDALFNGEGQGPDWARAQMLPVGAYAAGKAGADEATRQAQPIDPQIAALLVPPPAAPYPEVAGGKPPRTGMRRSRSKLQIVVWVMIGALVIGGGVFAGFQIRAIRLRRQIAAARDRAVDVARADTWQGWLGARDSLYSIAQASPTVDNKAALARARALLAYEFGDGLADARASVDGLAGKASGDLDVARVYLALAQSDAKTAREVADRAIQDAPADPARLYVQGQAQLLAGDVKAAVATLRGAADKEPRPLYLAGYARALAAATAWDDAVAAIDKVRDNPAATIARAEVLAAAGRAADARELRAQLAKLVADAQKPGDDHAAPAQLAFAQLALAQLEFARNEPAAAHAAYLASLAANLDDQRFAEQFAEVGYAIGELDTARKAASRAIEKWPTSRRARAVLAQVWLAAGKAGPALELFTKAPDAAAWPRGQTVRGQLRLATGDLEGARADFDAALKKLPGYEPAVIARTWLDLAAGDVEGARARVEPKLNPKTATVAMIAVYAAVLRATNDPAARDKAKALLERAVGGPPSVDVARAQLELARIDRDLGDLRAALAAYGEAGRTGDADARLETAQVLIENGTPKDGRELLEQLLKDAGDHASAALVIETARARALQGAHAGAGELLATADKLPGAIAWQVARERGRLALRKNDTASAAREVERALTDCGGDLETFLLAADVVSADDKQTALLGKLKTLAPTRLKGKPELDIVTGKLELAAGKLDDAERAYAAAREALMKAHASPRRRAQADFGLAAVAYFKHDDPTALGSLALVMIEDPSIWAAYLFVAELERGKEPRKALEHAQLAVALDVESLEGWRMVGELAGQLADKKLLATAISHVSDLAPGSELLRQLQALK
jgi:predicted Zn-dependent protease